MSHHPEKADPTTTTNGATGLFSALRQDFLASIVVFLCSFVLEFNPVSSAALSYRYSPVGGRLTFVKTEPFVAEPLVQVS